VSAEVHFRRKAGTLDELSYAPCGAGAVNNPTTIDPRDVTCPRCRTWLLPIWQKSATLYQAAKGVHEPWICEIAPSQYAGLSKRGKKDYDKKRSREWTASAQCKADYAAEVVAAFDRGEFALNTPDTHPDAETAVRGALRERAAKAAEQALNAARAASERGGFEAAVGDTVYDLMYGRYVHVIKLFKASLRVTNGAHEYTANRGRFVWLHYGEYKLAAERGLTVGRETLAELRRESEAAS
jgi:hypothetical protein